MSRQFSFRPPCNIANGIVRSQSHALVGHWYGTHSQPFNFGGQVQQVLPLSANGTSQTEATISNDAASEFKSPFGHAQEFSYVKFDPKYEHFAPDSYVRLVIENKNVRDALQINVQTTGKLPTLFHVIKHQIILRETSITAMRDELALKIQELKYCLRDIQNAKDFILNLEQMKEDGAIAHSTWTTETVEILARSVDFANDSLHSIKKKLGLTVIEDLRAIKSKIVLETLLFVAYRGGLAKNAEFVRNMAQLKEEGTFAIDFNTKQIFYEKKFNEATLLWCAAFYFFLDVKEARHNDKLEDKIFRLAEQKESPWIQRSFVQQVPQGLESQAMHANIFVGCKHQFPDTSRDESAPNVSFSFGSVSRSSKKRARHWQDEDQVER